VVTSIVMAVLSRLHWCICRRSAAEPGHKRQLQRPSRWNPRHAFGCREWSAWEEQDESYDSRRTRHIHPQQCC